MSGVGSTEPSGSAGVGLADAGAGISGVGSTEPSGSAGVGLADAGAGISGVGQADPVVQTLRSEIAALDARLLATINERIAVVAKLHRYKAEHGIPVRDHAREEELLDHLRSINPGPLSPAGLADLFTFVLELVRREAANA